MAIRVAINHLTEYRFDRPVALSPHVFRLRPAPQCRIPIAAYSLKIEPAPHFIHWQQDPFGNHFARVVFPELTRHLRVEVDLLADMVAINPFDFFLDEWAERFPFAYPPELEAELAPYLELREHGERLKTRVAEVDLSARNTVSFLVEINQQLSRDIAYTIRMEPGVQACEQTLALGSGSCRDSAWLLVQMLRHLGLAARFVSGYLVQLAPDQKPIEGPAGPAQDFTDLHAWAEVFLPGAGWVGLDPTSGLFAGEGHIPLACTPDPSGAAPVTGVMDPCEVEFYYHNEVARIHEDPRVTRPYSDEQWAHILALGEQVDEQLRQDDVRLTMGGEPTFISLDDMDGPEWNTLADGPAKRVLAHALFERMQGHYAPGGVRLYPQGKWYPGEPVPRWQYTCCWRNDGQPVWQDVALLASPVQPGEVSREQGATFAALLSRTLGLGTGFLVSAYEDVVYYLWREQQVPVDLDPAVASLKDGAERQRLAHLLCEGLDEPAGLVLPLQWNSADGYWQSCHWQLRTPRLFLMPGDSPLGLRLPLDRLAWAPRQPLADQPPDPFDDTPPLRVAGVRPPREPDGGFMSTALAVEVREGRLCVFLPPLISLDAWLQLIAVIEACARELRLPVLLEGYEPPRDARLSRFMVTPDPGVIEVNIHPAASWPALVENTTSLYELARQTRLTTEKFMLDGRQTGTGGGNHITLGGATPADSPLLRRPHLLQSLITYWQHHPGLSYLFSGLFVGPTSQAPRVDEGRLETLYELEIAFSQLPEGDSQQPWLIDRVLRHLLVDLTGNTHRAEFCIDKLYSPDGPTGRLGLLEFRGFEMPPHARMSLVQMLLLRTLLARFWREPYRKPLVRWGTALQDKFMLPHHVWEDVGQVVEELNDAGFPFRLEWLNPFLEFRFPVYGRVQVRDLSLELRTAIEPWHVLGEEQTRGGTSRFVDSSVERLQVRVSNMTDNRHVLTCNGRRVPLTPTGVFGEKVAGVRYRAWQPPSCLHPTIPPQSPLVFDVIDTWSGRSIGGCTYHVMHPGGRNYEVFPVNSLEAESRRIARFWAHGHTPGALTHPPELHYRVQSDSRFYPHGSPPGPAAPLPELPAPEYPNTLDLRHPPRFG